MRIIDTTDANTINRLEYLKSELIAKLKERGSYSDSDFALVRTTDHLDADLILKPLCQVPFVTNTNNVAHSTIYDLLRRKNNVNIFDEEEYEKFKVLADLYSPLSTQYRSTIHFTLNGLVSNHAKGTFDGRNFIIIDKLEQHLGVENFRTMRMEDTFIAGNFAISEKGLFL